MYGFPLDHLWRLVIILYYNVFAICICLKLFNTNTDIEAFLLYVGISGFNISECFASEGHRLAILEECSAKTIFTGISLQDKGLCMVIIS